MSGYEWRAMFTIVELNKNKININNCLSNNKHFATVYSIHTNDEDWESIYFVELKQQFPDSDIEKFVTLWKWQHIITELEGVPEATISSEYLIE